MELLKLPNSETFSAMQAIETVSTPVIPVLVILHLTDIATKYHTFMCVENARGSGNVGDVAIIPQKVYTAPNTHTSFKPEATIELWQGGLRGVFLHDATQDSFLRGETGITDGNNPITKTSNTEKIMIRLEVRIAYNLITM